MKRSGKESTVVVAVALAVEIGLILLFALRGNWATIEQRFTWKQLAMVSAALFFLYILYVELRLKRAGQTLVEEKIKTHTLVDCLPQAIAVVDPERRIITANGEACRRLSLDPVGAIGRDFPGLFDDDTAARLRGTFDGKTDAMLRSPARKLRVGVTALRGGGGALVVVEEPGSGTSVERVNAAAPRDMTELVSALWKSVSELDRELPGMSDESRLKFVEALVRARKTLNLVERPDAAPLRLGREHADVASIAREALERSMPLARAKRVRTEVQTLGDSGAAVDPGLLRRALDEIVFNALCYTGEGGVVKVAVDGNGKGIAVSVTDTGIGIPEEEFAKIFEAGFVGGNQLPETRGGMGIGLALARRVVEAHGGEMWVESRVGQGTRISLNLPRA